MDKRSILIISPPFPLSPNERQVYSLTFNDLSFLLWYETTYGQVSEFPQRTQHIFRFILSQLPIVCHNCDLYTCISPREKLTLKGGRKLARIIHTDITQNLYRFIEKIPHVKRRKSEENFLDAKPNLLYTFRLTISFAYETRGVIYIPHRDFLFFSLPEDNKILLIELKKLFENLDERYSSRQIHVFVTLKRFKRIKKGFVRGIVPIGYFLGAVVDYDYDPVDWSWVDNEPFRDPSTQFFLILILSIAIFGLSCCFVIL